MFARSVLDTSPTYLDPSCRCGEKFSRHMMPAHEMGVDDRDVPVRTRVRVERIARQINTPSAIDGIGNFVSWDDIDWLVKELRKRT
jgi:hypothetical protein